MVMQGIKDSERDFIKGIIHLICPNAAIYAFGSRVKDSAKPASDLDLIIKLDQEIELSDIIQIKEQMKVSRLPYSVDVSDWHALGAGFRDNIKDDLVEL